MRGHDVRTGLNIYGNNFSQYHFVQWVDDCMTLFRILLDLVFKFVKTMDKVTEFVVVVIFVVSTFTWTSAFNFGSVAKARCRARCLQEVTVLRTSNSFNNH